MIPRVHGVVGDSAQLTAGTPMISTQLEAAGVAAGYFGNNPFGMGRLEKPGNWTVFSQPGKEGCCTGYWTEECAEEARSHRCRRACQCRCGDNCRETG